MKQIDGPGLVRMIEAAGPAAPLLLDVREPWEFALGSIRVGAVAAVSMPMGSVPERHGELGPAQPVVCICHHGMRSAQVVGWLESRGHEAVYNLAGGTDAWSLEVDPTLPRY